MRIHYYHQFFAGPDAPGPAQPRNLVRRLASRGHEVHVIACDCNAYNEQTEPAERYAEGTGTVQVHRLPVPRNLRASLTNRLKTYGRFAWSACGYGRRLPAPDVVMASIQPLFGGFAALRAARRARVPFLLEIRDLWPDALVAKQAIAGWQAAPLQALAHHLYHGSDRVVSLTPGIKTELLRKGVRPEALDLLPNGFDAVAHTPVPGRREAMRAKLGWGDRFVAVYTGTHTEVTAIPVIVRAAAALRDRADIRIDLFGSGHSKVGAQALARELNLGNIHFHDAVPKSQVPAILDAADAGLMTLFHSPLIHIYFENKFIDYMGAGKPILAAMGGVQAGIIQRIGAGRVVPGMDHDGLARLIADAAAQPAECARMGAAGHDFISTRLDQGRILDRYAERLEALAAGRIREVPAWDPFT